MALAITYSRASFGISAPLVTVEAHISNGLPSLHIVGLPETAVKESRDRVRSAILNSHFEFPMRRITINLAPAELPKTGGRYDLPIAIGILAATKQLPADKLGQYELAGELALSGAIRPISGILPLAIGSRNAGKSLIIPFENLPEVEIMRELLLYPAKTLLEVCSHFLDKCLLTKHAPSAATAIPFAYQNLSDVRGQQHAKRALEIAAAGQHSLLMLGPPGAGKTLLSRCLPGILPLMSETAATELAAIQSMAGVAINAQNWRKRPFRAPHHSASSVALIGGGNPVQPGEISLAHQGVLFLDELPEFKRQALEALREPLESGTIAISRANLKIHYPAKFQLIAAMNPCPCGHYGSAHAECVCTPGQIKRYQARVSGPLLDRVDLHVVLQPLSAQLMTAFHHTEESSEFVAERIKAARDIQEMRAQKPNALLTNQEIERFCSIEDKDSIMIEKLMQQKKMSARSYFKVLKLARTIADLQQAPAIMSAHLKEAFSYRVLK